MTSGGSCFAGDSAAGAAAAAAAAGDGVGAVEAVAGAGGASDAILVMLFIALSVLGGRATSKHLLLTSADYMI